MFSEFTSSKESISIEFRKPQRPLSTKSKHEMITVQVVFFAITVHLDLRWKEIASYQTPSLFDDWPSSKIQNPLVN